VAGRVVTGEPIAAKAHRLLAFGRLVVRHVDPERIVAHVRGDTGSYDLGRDARGWWCACPAVGRCSHLIALRLVTTATRGAELC
jgi:hypothetical protein